MEENKNNFPEEKDINITEETTAENTVDEQTETTLETAHNDTEANSEKKSKKKGKVGKIILVVLGVLVAILLAALLAVRIWVPNAFKLITWDNITAAFNSWWYSTEDLEKQMQTNKEKMEKIAKEDPLIEIRGELTEEEVLALKNGEITPEEAKLIVKGETTLEQIRENKKKAEESESSETEQEPEQEPNQEPAQPVAKDRVSEIVSELYVVQAEFITKLEGIGDKAYEDYKATHYNRAKVMEIVDSYTEVIGQMEAECDKTVNGLIKELKAELTKVGRDHSLAKEIQNYYYTEKSLKKSYYLDRLNDENYK